MGPINKLRLSVLLVLLCGCAAFAQTIPQSEPAGNPEQLFARAATLLQTGQLDEAIRAWELYLAQRPDHLEARSNLGATFARLGRYAEAIEQYQRALTFNKSHAGVRFNLAVALYKSGRLAAAAPELEEVVGQQPGNHKAALLLADCYLQLGENKKVVDLLMPRAGRTEDRALAYLLGTALIRDRQVEQGQVWIERIMRQGDSAEARLLIGTSHLLAMETAEALKELEQAIRLDPNLPSAHSYYGRALLLAGDAERARTVFQRELVNNPNNFEAHLHLGLIYKQAQQPDIARKYLQRALELRPGEPNARLYLASLQISQGNTLEALPDLEKLVQAAPDFLEAHVLLATVYYRLKRKADGDREQAVVLRLQAEQQSNKQK
jgi:tetratricopeptide (TPR) repeat protein